jgi:hypothetical protein
MRQHPQSTHDHQKDRCEDLALSRVQQRQALAEDIALLVVRQYRRGRHAGRHIGESADRSALLEYSRQTHPPKCPLGC